MNYAKLLKVAIVGSGPAGFYTAQKLLKNAQISVDIFEKLPVPFGLVRYGVAPDHAEVKNVIKSFTNVANSNRVNFLGNVSIGKDLTLRELFLGYHAVILCYGSSQDRYLNIDGESSTNVVSARQLVGWYNGDPSDKDLKLDLDCDTACIIGQGNVALDCARILLKPPGLDKTDIASQAYAKIAKSKVRRIVVVGRRGPVQVAFTTKEFRELIKFNHCSIDVGPPEIKLCLNDSQYYTNLSRQRRRLTELIADASKKIASDKEFKIEFRFMRSPIKIKPSCYGNVEKIVFTKNKFLSSDAFFDEKASIKSDLNDIEELNCGLVIRSIGYRAILIDSMLPFDQKRGVIINQNGRVQGFTALYCSGWLATGPTGVIANTLQSSIITVDTLLKDIDSNLIPDLRIEKEGLELILKILDSRSVQVVKFNDWLKIDKMEKKIGELMGKPREKLTELNDMLKIAKSDHE